MGGRVFIRFRHRFLILLIRWGGLGMGVEVKILSCLFVGMLYLGLLVWLGLFSYRILRWVLVLLWRRLWRLREMWRLSCRVGLIGWFYLVDLILFGWLFLGLDLVLQIKDLGRSIMFRSLCGWLIWFIA